MEKEVQKIREMAKVFREVADAADMEENPNSTEQEKEEVIKDYFWKVMKLQVFE